MDFDLPAKPQPVPTCNVPVELLLGWAAIMEERGYPATAQVMRDYAARKK